MPKVSLIIPVYNDEKYLRQALDSVLAQTMTDFEAICVDDGSTDSSPEILVEYAARDSRLRVIRQENRGAGAARNAGIREATGEYTYFFDADDLCAPDLLELTVAKAEATHADIVAFDFLRFYPDGKRERRIGIHTDRLPKGIEVFNYHDCPDRIMTVINPTPWNKLYRTDFICEKGLHFEEISSSNDITFSAVSVAMAERIAFIKKELFFYRWGQAGTITSTKQKNIGNVVKAVESAIAQASRLPYSGEISRAITYFAIDNYIYGLYNNVKGLSSPVSRVYYERIREYFLRPEFDALDREQLENDTLFNRVMIVRKRDYDAYSRLRSLRLIVSCTSYPARIGGVALVLKTILDQTHPADAVLLYLAKEQFPNGGDDLPDDLRELIDSGAVTLKWCRDLRPHKKYFYAFQQYPDDLVVTIDDDLLYDPMLLERLYDSYLLYPEAVSTARAHLMCVTPDGSLLPYGYWLKEVDEIPYEPSMQLCATGGAGAIYPPHLLPKEMLDENAIVETCLNADDLWLKAMELMADVPVVIACRHRGLKYLPGSQQEALCHDNLDHDVNSVYLKNIASWLETHYGPGVLEAKLLSQDSGTRMVGDAKLHQLYGSKIEKLTTKLKEKLDLQIVAYARIDVKNAGADSNDVDVFEISDSSAKIETPEWLCASGGRGRVIKSTSGKLSLKFKCSGDGKLRLTLRGAQLRGQDGKRVPVWVNYRKLAVDEKVVFDELKPAWHNKSFNYSLDVRDGQIVDVSVEWDPDSITIGEGMGQVIAASREHTDELKAKLKNSINPRDVSYARLDIKNAGAEANDVDVVEISDPSAKVDAPAWMCAHGGRGRVIKSTSGKLALKLKCSGDGKLRITLRGAQLRGQDGKGIPVWVSYTKLVVDGKVVFDELKPAWHNKSFNYSLDVRDGQIVDVSVEWAPESVTIGKGMGQVIAVSRERIAELKAKFKNSINPRDVSYARLDIKNAGPDTNDIEVVESSDPSAKVDAPAWLCAHGGRGRVIKSTSGKLALTLKPSGDGKLEISLRTALPRDEDGKTVHVWLDYTRFAINGETIFDETKPISHNRPHKYTMDVKDGQVVNVAAEWDPASVTIGKGMRQVIAVSQKANKRADELATKLAKAEEELAHLRRRVKALTVDVSDLNAQMKSLDATYRDKLKLENDAKAAIEAQLNDIRSGLSFRIGRVITWLPRKLLGRQ